MDYPRRDSATRSSAIIAPGELKLNSVDRLVGFFSPTRGLARQQARVMSSILKRSYEGASTSRRTAGWHATGASANAEIGPALAKLRARSRDMVRNNGYASSAIEKLVSNIIGTGIMPRAKTGDDARNKAADALWLEWSTVCDADGQLDFAGLQALATRTTAEAGECLVLLRNRRPSAGLPIPLQLQLLEPDHLDTNKIQNVGNGGVILNGVEFDSMGRRIAYWLFPTHPGDQAIGGSGGYVSKRFPAKNIIHLFRKTRPAQVRGVPWMASIMLRMRDLDEYADAELWRKKVAACFAAFVTRPEGTSGSPIGVAKTTTDGVRTDSIEPGMIEYLYQGEGVEFGKPPDSGAYQPYMQTELRGAAAGANVTYEQLTSDLSGVNFSSLRAGMQEFRRWAQAVQAHVVNSGFNRPIWRRAMLLAQVSGELGPGRIGAEWTPQRWPFIEPLKDAQADILLARSGFESMQQIINRYGHNSDDQLAELAEFAKAVDEAGLVLDTDPRKTTRAGMFQTEIDSDGGTKEPADGEGD